MKTITELINESKKCDSKTLADEYIKMTIDNNNSETIEDDIEIFLDAIGDALYDKDQKLYARFQKGIIKLTNKWSKY